MRTTTTFPRAKSYLTRRIKNWFTKHGPEEGFTRHAVSICTTGIDDEHLAIEHTVFREGDPYDINELTDLCRIYYYKDYPLWYLYEYWEQWHKF